jgi:hypothetical protein
MTTRGIPEVPLGIEPQLRRHLTDIRQQLLDLRARQAPPDVPTNLNVTAQAFSNLIQFTRSADADYYEILVSNSPDIHQSFVVDIGNSPQWVDHIGAAAVKHFYWVRARKRTGARSIENGPVIATTLGSAIGVIPPVPPPPGHIIVIDQTTGRRIAYTLINRE